MVVSTKELGTFWNVSDSSLVISGTNQILGRVATDSIYRNNLQTSFSLLDQWLNSDFGFISSSKEPEVDFSACKNLATDFELLEIPDDPSEVELTLVPIFDPLENQEIILEIYNKLKQVFEILETILSIELYSSVLLITLFSQQFGGNRDLPVAFA